MSCPDCKDGFYYPLIGSPEPCQTCKSTTRPPADIAFYEGDSSQDAAFDMRGTDSASFDRDCRTAFNGIVFKDNPRIYYSANEMRSLGIEFYSQHSRKRRIALLISNIKHCFSEEVLFNGVKWFDVNIRDSKFFELWDMDHTAWKTGVYLKMTPNYGEHK